MCTACVVGCVGHDVCESNACAEHAVHICRHTRTLTPYVHTDIPHAPAPVRRQPRGRRSRHVTHFSLCTSSRPPTRARTLGNEYHILSPDIFRMLYDSRTHTRAHLLTPASVLGISTYVCVRVCLHIHIKLPNLLVWPEIRAQPVTIRAGKRGERRSVGGESTHETWRPRFVRQPCGACSKHWVCVRVRVCSGSVDGADVQAFAVCVRRVRGFVCARVRHFLSMVTTADG